MIFRTLLFFVVMYFLVKFISRMFLPSEPGNRNRKGPGFFYTFGGRQQQQQQQNRNRHSRQSNNGSQRFEEIEEAEYEDVTDEEKETSKSPD